MELLPDEEPEEEEEEPDALPACLPVSFTATQAHVFLSARDTAGVLRYTPLETVSFARAGAEN